jgi:hypothetical protein
MVPKESSRFSHIKPVSGGFLFNGAYGVASGRSTRDGLKMEGKKERTSIC